MSTRMLESFVLYVARNRAQQYGKSYLIDTAGILELIAEACKQMDITMDQEVKSFQEYISGIINEPVFDEIGKELLFLHNNLGVKRFDTSFNAEKKIDILKSSIECFKDFFAELKENYNYAEFQLSQNQLKDGDRIIENLEIKIEDNDEIEKIINSMECIGLNFIINYKGQDIYPIISDLLIDTVTAEYLWSIDKKVNQAIITEWKNAKESQKENKTFKFMHFTKMELIEKIKYDNLRAFLLSEYERVLKVDKKNLRKFIQHILYYDVENHKYTPKLKLDMIDKIPRRPFMLERTKIVIGGV